MHLFSAVLVFMLLVAGCSSHPHGPPGKGILKKEQLIDLLVDMHYFEGIYSVTGGTGGRSPSRETDTLDYYRQILERHGISREDFRNTMRYYSYHPPLFESLYDRVMDELRRRLSEAEMVRPEPEQPPDRRPGENLQ